MNSIKGPLIFFALVLFVMVGAALVLGNPEGSSDAGALAGIEDVVAELGLNMEDLLKCTDEGTAQERVSRDIQKGTSIGVTGTPAIILLNTETQNTTFVRGAYPFEILAQVIAKLLNEELNEGDVVFENTDMGVRLDIGKIPDIGLVEDDHIRGNPDAKIALIEYSDPDCPYCAQFHATAIQLLDTFGDDLAWVYRHFPITQTHPSAARKSALSECAAKAGGEEAFWTITDAFYSN